MVLYEVNLVVNRDIYGDFLSWLREHINEMLCFEGFVKADLWTLEAEDQGSSPDAICVQYHLESRDKLNTYLNVHAPRMRKDGIRRFGGKFSATRRILNGLQV